MYYSFLNGPEESGKNLKQSYQDPPQAAPQPVIPNRPDVSCDLVKLQLGLDYTNLLLQGGQPEGENGQEDELVLLRGQIYEALEAHTTAKRN